MGGMTWTGTKVRRDVGQGPPESPFLRLRVTERGVVGRRVRGPLLGCGESVRGVCIMGWPRTEGTVHARNEVRGSAVTAERRGEVEEA